MQDCSFRAMGCQMLALIDADSVRSGDALARVPGWLASWEQRLSRFRDDSELAKVNRAAGEPTPVGDVFWEVLLASLEAARRSEGLVVPTMLTALEQAGYDRSFEQIAPGAVAQPARQVPTGDWRQITFEAASRSIRLLEGMRLDFGGVAKGWSADRAAALLGRYGPALIDAGGDIAVSGPMADGQPWCIGVADPFVTDSDTALLLVSRGGVATSGRDYRRWQQGGVWQHHIIDPRTGLPAETDVLSATVVGPSACTAEMAAKALLIQGSKAGMEWLNARPEFAGLCILENGRIVYSHNAATVVAEYQV